MFRRMSTATTRTYEECVHLLNTTQTNAAVLEALRKSGNSLNKQSLPEVTGYVNRIGYKVPDLNQLNIIHIAGTKGKGSTSALCDSILRQCVVVNQKDGSTRELKTGLFTSPHLIQARERIRINGIPVSETDFQDSFTFVWNAFEGAEKPGYFRFLFLMSIHRFLTSQTDVSIMETGIGGEFDCTNIFETPYVTAITSLGLDHQGLLGNTVAEIGWHKAGIMKRGVACFTAPQVEDAMRVLRVRAVEKGVSKPISCGFGVGGGEVGMKGAHQFINAAVAVSTCKEWVQVYNQKHVETQCVLTDDAILKGLGMASWPGRAQTFNCPEFPNAVFYLDGAHTPESLLVCGEWFDQVLEKEGANKSGERNMLIFYCTGGRSADELLSPLAQYIKKPLSDVIFCSSDSKQGANVNNTNFTVVKDTAMKTQYANKAAWERVSTGTIHEKANVHVFPTLDQALELANERPTTTRALVTGSMYLIGGVLTRCNAPVQ
ncbi:Mur ligase [Obelidium mucronatum]|nr:Mur ligase [Obelidium mucronatum]